MQRPTEYLPLELKNDICAALELNESCYINLTQGDNSSGAYSNGNDMDSVSSRASQEKYLSQEHISMVCGIRARLMQALEKATDFFENNIELLATIASLKRETAMFRDEQRQTTQVLNGRISSLLEIVREQQESLDRKQETLALKGIWANLLHVSPDGNVRHPTPLHRLTQKEKEHNKREGREEEELDDYAANVITWLSLQCAQEAEARPHTSQRPPQRHTRHNKENKSSPGTGSPLSHRIEDKLGGVNSVSDLVQKVGSLFHTLDSVTQTTEQENSTMRVKLQEMSAICSALRREREQQESEIERWKDAISVLQTDHDYSSNQASLLSQENKRLRASIQAEKASSENWRSKCHEILEAVEKTSELTSSLQNESVRHNATSSSPSLAARCHSSTRGGHDSHSHSHIHSSHSHSPSTFYSHQQHLFSPPGDSSHSSQQASYVHNNTSTVPPPCHAQEEKCTLDSYCNLVEQADVVTQSPPTPFVTEAQLSTRAPATGTAPHSLSDANALRSSPSTDDYLVTSATQRTVSPKVIDPIDPRELDDSTLYKMLLEAENEIGELSPDEDGGGAGAGAGDSSEDNPPSSRDMMLQSAFLASIDLQSAIAHGHELMHPSSSSCSSGGCTGGGLSPAAREEPCPTSSPEGSSSTANTSSHFESSSYNTPNKSKSASKQFSKSLQLKKISASKSASKEWNSYFTRGGGNEPPSAESPYDVVLRRYKGAALHSNAPAVTDKSESLRPSSSSSSTANDDHRGLVPISPIPLVQAGQ
jgi:hypothetical protein